MAARKFEWSFLVVALFNHGGAKVNSQTVLVNNILEALSQSADLAEVRARLDQVDFAEVDGSDVDWSLFAGQGVSAGQLNLSWLVECYPTLRALNLLTAYRHRVALGFSVDADPEPEALFLASLADYQQQGRQAKTA